MSQVVRRGMRPVVFGARLVLGALGAPIVYLAVVTVAGLRRTVPFTGRSAAHTRFAILVPAHDEAAGIERTLESFRRLDYPSDRFAVHVVADNCTDATAEVVRRHGWEAHERVAPELPGKGHALNWLHDRLVDRGDEFDAVAIVDADTSVDRAFLVAMDDALVEGVHAAQGYYSVRDADSSPMESFRFAALVCRHHLRPNGRNRLGGSCGLYGNGMVFTRELIATRRWSGHLVEDAEFQMDLLLDGHLVHYVPGAKVEAEMPVGMEQATSQNAWWERGRIDLARRYVPVLARRVVTERSLRLARVDAIVDHLVPPLSVVAALQIVGIAGSAVVSLADPRAARRLALFQAGTCLALVGHVLCGLWAVRAPRHHYLSLITAPRIVVWKVALWSGVARRTDVEWIRTERRSERVG